MRRSFKYSIALAIIIIGYSTISAQPVISRGQQIMSIAYDDCLRRAYSAFTAEGWVNIGTSGNAVNGYKASNSSYIVCSPAPNNQMAVHIFVASSSGDANVPGAERVRLQNRMAEAGGGGGGGGGGNTGGGGVQVNWGTNAVNYRGQNVRVTYLCPPGGTAGSVWGTDYYTDDSSVCTAAVHMGLITFANGGRVTFEMRQGAASYNGTSRYGVSSANYGSWSGSYVFVR